MNFYAGFWKVVRSRPLAALGALYWHWTGRKVRARNRLRINLAQSPQAYSIWINTIERRERVVAQAPMIMTDWRHHPIFSIVFHLRENADRAAIGPLIAMMQAQIYPEWEIIIVPTPDAPKLDVTEASGLRFSDIPAARGSEALEIGARLARGDYLLPLPTGSMLPSTALYHYAEAIQSHPTAALLFGDNDWIDARGARRQPWFKPQWNAELALSQDYVSQALVVSREAACNAMHESLAADSEAAYALALTVASTHPQDVRHVPLIQSHLRDMETKNSQEERRSIVQAHLDRADAKAIASIGQHGTIQVDWPLANPHPLVSIIIPTRDKVALLRACLSSLLARTSYKPFEILIVDNGSQQESALAYLAEVAKDPAVRVLRDDRSYNFSQLNNMAVARAQGNYLCLLNNDTEIIDGDWLTAMMRHAIRPHIGAVGAQLLYADRSIQHAGVVVGLGDAAGHAHRFQSSTSRGYFARAHTAHYASAVTAACLVVSKEKFLAVGGLDEENLAVAFNDVDFCLKLQQAGWHNLYTPQATLLHHESKSRGRDTSARNIDRYRLEWQVLRQRWNSPSFADPLHHPHLDRSAETYTIRL